MSIDLRTNRFVIQSFEDRYGDLREKNFDPVGHFRHLVGLADIDALAEEVNFGLTGQFTTAIDGFWSYLYLACESGHAPERSLSDMTSAGYCGLRPGWRLRSPMTLDGLARIHAIHAAEVALG